MIVENANGTLTNTGRETTRAERKTEADFARERAADRVLAGEIKKTFRWTDEDLERAIATYSFPKSIGTQITGVMTTRRETIHSRSAIAAWQQQIQTFVAALPRR